MDTRTRRDDEQSAPPGRRVSTDLVLGIGLLGIAIIGRLLWTVSDVGILGAIGG